MTGTPGARIAAIITGVSPSSSANTSGGPRPYRRGDEPGDDDAGRRQGEAGLESAEGTDGYGRSNDGRFRSARRSGGGRHRR